MKNGSTDPHNAETASGLVKDTPDTPFGEKVKRSALLPGLKAVKVYDPDVRFITLSNSLNVRAASGLKVG